MLKNKNKYVPLNKAFALSHMHQTVFVFTFEGDDRGKWTKTAERPLLLTICGFTNNPNYDIFISSSSSSSSSSLLSTTVAQPYLVLQKQPSGGNTDPFVVRNTGILDRRAYRLYVLAQIPQFYLTTATSLLTINS
jgi:hypothetical protein